MYNYYYKEEKREGKIYIRNIIVIKMENRRIFNINVKDYYVLLLLNVWIYICMFKIVCINIVGIIFVKIDI